MAEGSGRFTRFDFCAASAFGILLFLLAFWRTGCIIYAALRRGIPAVFSLASGRASHFLLGGQEK
ncbi:MAG TPA: hypothetical protein PLJ77_12355, partial [Dokdonella sp.]|nr:hypothetical protein [Dokdonella sp.]